MSVWWIIETINVRSRDNDVYTKCKNNDGIIRKITFGENYIFPLSTHKNATIAEVRLCIIAIRLLSDRPVR